MQTDNARGSYREMAVNNQEGPTTHYNKHDEWSLYDLLIW